MIEITPLMEMIDWLARRLRTGDPGVFGRIEDDWLILDVRTVLPEDDAALADAIQKAFRSRADTT